MSDQTDKPDGKPPKPESGLVAKLWTIKRWLTLAAVAFLEAVGAVSLGAFLWIGAINPHNDGPPWGLLLSGIFFLVGGLIVWKTGTGTPSE